MNPPTGPSEVSPHLQPLWLAGATATGKSAVALHLAERLHGEIISVDSMQVYRGLDLGTAKPTPAEQRRIPHHLIDIVHLTETFDAAQFVRRANAAVSEIQSRNHRPIFCGGTGLYFKACLAGLGEAPPADPALRAQLETTPLPDLLAELHRTDPATFEKIDRQNPRRVIRALEVIRLTKKPFSTQRSSWSTTQSATTIWGLIREPADLQARINTRVDQMFHRGLVDEVKKLLPLGLEKNPTALQAIGYRQVVEHLRGQHTLPQTIELVKIRTRQFAKRQLTWFRRQLPLTWLPCTPTATPKSLADQILSRRTS